MNLKSEIKSRSFFDDLRVSLKTYRVATDTTQADVAELVGVSRAQISNFENGTSLPREDALEKILEIVRSPTTMLANEVRGLSEMLLSTTIPDDVKVANFLSSIKDLEMLAHRAWGKLEE